MNIFTYHHSYLNTFFRSIPITLPIITFIIYIFLKDIYIFYFCLGMIISQISIPYIKYICKFFGYYLIKYNNNNIELPIIGRISRPTGANNCGCFYKNPDNLATSSGMPSGHSILAGFTSIFLYYYLINKYKIDKRYYTVIFILCLSFTLYTMYTRVLFNCHTIQQTVIGAIIGMIYGYYWYIFINKLINK